MIIFKLLRIYEIFIIIALVLYLPRIFGFRYGFSNISRRSSDKKRRIGVIIPARNESVVIGDLFDSLSAQTYDKDFYDVFVIVKEEDDPTVEMAKKNGYHTLVVPEQTCKGDALDTFFKSPDMPSFDAFDAFVIVDADGVLAPDYLSELNNALESDADIFVTKKMFKNAQDGKDCRSLYSNCAALTWPIIDELGNCYRMKKGIPLMLTGQGLAFRSHVIKEVGGWPYHTITEDYEFRLDSMLRGYKSVYCPYAVLYTEEATGRKENFIRRARWVTGRCQCHKKYRKAFLKSVKRKKRINKGEFEFFFGLIPYMIFMVATIVTNVFGLYLTGYYIMQKSDLFVKAFILLVALPQLIQYALLLIFSILALESSRSRFDLLTRMERIEMVVFNPIFLLEYIFVYIKGIVDLHRKNGLVWKQTERVNKDKHEK